MRAPFRIRVVWADGNEADFDVVAVTINSWNGEELKFSTENGLTIFAPEEPEEDDPRA